MAEGCAQAVDPSDPSGSGLCPHMPVEPACEGNGPQDADPVAARRMG